MNTTFKCNRGGDSICRICEPDFDFVRGACSGCNRDAITICHDEGCDPDEMRLELKWMPSGEWYCHPDCYEDCH